MKQFLNEEMLCKVCHYFAENDILLLNIFEKRIIYIIYIYYIFFSNTLFTLFTDNNN